jgi:hypothetical protein
MSADDFDREQHCFAEHYARLSDGELRKIALDPWALSEAAWDALENEFDRRNMDLPVPESSPEIEAPEKRSLILLRRFRDLPEALLAKAKLESAGIPCFFVDDNTVRMDWLWSNALGGVKILVDAENFSEAAKLLNEPIPEGLDFEEAETYSQPRCPKCQSLDINFEELYKPLAFSSLFVNFPLPVHRQGWICQACGHIWHDESGASLGEPSAQTPPE